MLINSNLLDCHVQSPSNSERFKSLHRKGGKDRNEVKLL